MLAGQTFPTPTNCCSGLSGARVDYFVFQIAALRTAHINRSPETTTYSGWGKEKIQLKFLLTSAGSLRVGATSGNPQKKRCLFAVNRTRPRRRPRPRSRLTPRSDIYPTLNPQDISKRTSGIHYPIEDEDEYDQPSCASPFSCAINSLPVDTKNAGRPKPPCIQSYMTTYLLAEA